MTKVIIKAADGTGAVEAYHNANKKIETTATGTTVTGNIAVTGTVDGRDIATDGTKLDGIAAGANVGAALTGSTNNTVCTVTGANAIAGEANLTFDGHDITQTIDADAEGFDQTAAGNHYIKNIATSVRTSAGAGIWNQTAKWNTTEVAAIKMQTGPDTTNKDDGIINFHTTSGGTSGERMRIDSSGRTLFGHTASVNAWGLGRKIQVHGTDGATASIAATRWSNDANPSSLILAKSRSGTPGSFTTVADDDYIGTIGFLGDDGTDLGESVSRIDCRVDGTVGGNQLPGRLEFSTTKSNGQSTVKMTIDSSGYVTKPNTPAFAVRQYNNASTNAAMDSAGNIEFATELFDVGGHYDTSNGRFTAPVAGKYFFYCNLLIDNNASAGIYNAKLYKNGSWSGITFTYTYHLGGSNYHHMSGSGLLSLAANDYVQVNATSGFHNGSETNWGGFLVG